MTDFQISFTSRLGSKRAVNFLPRLKMEFIIRVIQIAIDTHRYNGHFQGEPRLAGCPLNSHSPCRLLLKYASFWDTPKLSMPFLTQSHQVFLSGILSV